jgi:hypothetical protein
VKYLSGEIILTGHPFLYPEWRLLQRRPYSYESP